MNKITINAFKEDVDVNLLKINSMNSNTLFNYLENLTLQIESLLKVIKDNSQYKKYYYHKLLNILINIKNIELKIFIKDLIVNNLNNHKEKNNIYYKIVIDAYIYTAIECFEQNLFDISLTLFKQVTDYGEKYRFLSKENYFDALNCAYWWLGYYYQTNKQNDKALACYKKIVNNYEEVKDDPNYFTTEKDTVNISLKNIKLLEALKKEQN